MTVRAARDKMKGKGGGKGELAVSFSGNGKREVARTELSLTVAEQIGCKKGQVNLSRVWTTRPLSA